ncbi:hypothetical protein OAE61_00580 [Verrucomicrobiales bacterium]|nr:hypothetical protein [bacterium]MDB4662108.1 hypothetical protein [Verrucomicrobiales bacterium]MDC0321778.1 hypothetical protein [Verrucomicrobiales bacterium]
MIRQFSNFEAACFFANRKREEGYFAEILDEGSGFLYGPIMTGGFRVIVSELSAEDGENPPHQLENRTTGFDIVLRNTILVGFSGALFVSLLVFVKRNEFSASGAALQLFGTLIVIALGISAASVCGIFIGRAIRWLFSVSENSDHRDHSLAKFIIALIAIFCLLFV